MDHWVSIRIHLQKFEGPLGLLLHLIRKHEMDIYDIEIHLITRQYLEHIEIMRELDLEVAGEFISMAALLIHIKSQMILPQHPSDSTVAVGQEDPRRELVDRLLEYQRYQDATMWFRDRHLLGRDTWKRGLREIWSDEKESIVLDEGGLYAMISLYRRVLKKAQGGVHVVMEKMQSLAARIMELRNYFVPGQTITFSDLLEKAERTSGRIIITFMSILELSRLGFTSLYQNDDCGSIQIQTKKLIEKDIVSQVQELENEMTAIDSLHTSGVAGIQNPVDVGNSNVNDGNLGEGSESLAFSATDDDIEAMERVLELESDSVREDVPGSNWGGEAFNSEKTFGELELKMQSIVELTQVQPQSINELSEQDLEAVKNLAQMEQSASLVMESVPFEESTNLELEGIAEIDEADEVSPTDKDREVSV